MDRVSDSQYREIYDEVRAGRSLREVVTVLGVFSIAWWSKYERGRIDLNRDAKDALRSIANLPPLPPDPAEVVKEAGVSLVVKASDEPDTAVLVGPEVERVNLQQNGKKRPPELPPAVSVTTVTRQKRHRKPRTGITVCPEVGSALKRLKASRGQTWNELLSGLAWDSKYLESVLCE